MSKELFFFLILIFLSVSIATAQTISSSTLNTTGGAKKVETGGFKNYSFEWSVGESSIITVKSAGDFQLSHGLLQGFLLISPLAPLTGEWFPNEIKIYPNPVKTTFAVEILSSQKGVLVLQLFNLIGQLIQTKSFEYYGEGSTQYLTIGSQSSGIYTLRVLLKSFPLTGGSVKKQGTYKIVKIH